LTVFGLVRRVAVGGRSLSEDRRLWGKFLRGVGLHGGWRILADPRILA
jgi:hypothetical protein